MAVEKRFRKREAILACLRSTRSHPRAEWVYQELRPEYPDLSLGTVYRNLALFKEQGLISSLGTVDGVERFDGDPRPHAHFLCQVCGAIRDLPQPELPEEVTQAAEALSGGRVLGFRLCFTGVCPACQRSSEGGESE